MHRTRCGRCGRSNRRLKSHESATDLILAPGMTITLEPGIVGPDGVFIVEQNLVVTNEGSELLSGGPWEIWIA
jgi:Xaa-Pro aminopeptidase